MAATVSEEVLSHTLLSGERQLGLDDLRELLKTYLPPEQIRDIDRAYAFGARAHEGQHRLTGEPYIFHPLAVAHILAEMRMDHQSIMGAILHDVMEDAPI